jgi:hypothetical protein
MRRTGGARLERFGAGALVVALALAGLAAQPGPRDDAAPRAARPPGTPAAVPGLAATGARTPAVVPARPVEAVTESADRVEARAGEAADPVAEPVLRTPAELAPEGPDVIVAVQAEEPGAPRLVAAHAHVTDSAEAGAPRASVAVDGAVPMGPGDGVEGPEPGALYWFGPRGLEKVLVVMEAQR